MLLAAMFAYSNPQPIDVDFGFVKLERDLDGRGVRRSCSWPAGCSGCCPAGSRCWRNASEKRRLRKDLRYAEAELRQPARSRRCKMPTDATFLLAALFIIGPPRVGFAFKVYSDRDRDLPPRISADYIRGLNLVLSRKTDEALELFVQMAKVDDDTLETHFALGHLFRRRGEVERAIRVHQNLLARPNLNETQRHQAVFSLAEDYLGAGLFDRAEQLLRELIDSPTLAEAALEKLVYIYEREREWQKAIEAQRKLEMLSGIESSQVAHYYCELAEAARAARRPRARARVLEEHRSAARRARCAAR